MQAVENSSVSAISVISLQNFPGSCCFSLIINQSLLGVIQVLYSENFDFLALSI